MGSFTPNLNLYKPLHNEVGWDGQVNSNFDKLDTAIGSIQTTITALSPIATSGSWSDLKNATASLTLANAGFTTTFNQTSGVNWTWANTTIATALTTNVSPNLILSANYWTGSASAADTWSVGSSLAAGSNSTPTLTFNHAGSTALGPRVSFQVSGVEVLRVGLRTNAGTNNISCPKVDQNLQLTGNISTTAGGSGFGVVLANQSPFIGTAQQQVGVGLGTIVSPFTFSPSSGAGAFYGAQVNATCAQTGTATGNFTGFQVNALGNTGGTFLGTTFLVADFVSDAGSVFQVGTSGAIFPTGGGSFGTLTDNAASKGAANAVLTAGSGGSGVVWSTTVPTSAIPWSVIGAAAANLTLANAGFTTTFNQTSGVAWTWANTTTATVSTTNASPTRVFSANYWTGAASAADTWTLGTSLAAGTNGISTFSFVHAGSTGAPQIQIPTQATASTPNLVSALNATDGINVNPISGIPLTVCTASGATYARFYTSTTIRGTIGTQASALFFAVDSASTGPLLLRGASAGNNSTTLNTSPAVILGQSDRVAAGFNATSGTQVGVSHGSNEAISSNGFGQLNFIPTSGSANFVASRVLTTINQTGTSSGNYTGLLVNVVETALKGTANKLLDLQAGSTGGTSMFSISNAGALTTYNGESAAGVGTAYVRGITSQKAETGADATLLSVTPPAVAGLYRIAIVLTVSAASAATLGWTATWTDSNAHAQAPTNLSLSTAGSATIALTVTAAANSTYYGEWYVDVNNAGTAIVVKTTFSGTSIAYKATATIERLG